tara:strand:- start:83 stop:544 length:462 start_codon:yes stop_codon:yes gene_type:complete
MPGIISPELGVTSATAAAVVGETYCAPDGKVYKYVQFVDLDAVAGQPVLPANAAGTSVSIDVSGGSAIGARAMGVAAQAVDISDKAFGWIQISGVADVETDGNVTAGAYLIAGTADGDAHAMSAGEEHLVFAVALETDSGSPTTSSSLLVGCW